MDPIQRADNIRSLLFQRGLTFSDIDRRYGLPEGTAWRAAHREPHADGEAALADALALDPAKTWPERYDPASGQRLERQPLENYRQFRPRRQRRNGEAA